jgi:serpin B
MRRMLAMVLLVGLVGACGDAEELGDRPKLAAGQAKPAQRTALVGGITDMGLGLYRELPADENVMISPLSISLVLGIGYRGARGETATQMAEILGYPVDPDQLGALQGALFADVLDRAEKDDDTLAIANSLWVQENAGLLPEFIEDAKRDAGATVEEVDYGGDPAGAAGRINDWVEDRTNGKIKDLVKPDMFDALSRLTVANAIYLKAKWKDEFEKSATSDATFTLAKGESISVPTMKRKGDMGYAEIDATRAVMLPYRGDLAFVAVLPPVGDMNAWEETFDASRIKELLAAVERDTLEVSLTMPRFEFRLKRSLKDDFITLGMPLPFDDQRADFTGISTKEPLHISFLVHQAYVKVDEEGTEAAAATAGGFKTVGGKLGVDLHLDRPFLFLIVDRPTGTPLFLGRVADPRSGGSPNAGT